MSQPADAPDGSDPRILAPSEDEPDVIIKASGGGSSRAYHTARCRNVTNMNSTRTVKQSVAEWKGFDECEVCIHEGEYDPTPDDETETDTASQYMSRETCAEVRRRCLRGESIGEMQADYEWGWAAINNHVRGRCSELHDVDAPACAYGWHVDTDTDETGREAVRADVSVNECRIFRQQLRAGETRSELSERHNISPSAISTHATGRCYHPPDAHVELPLAHGWHAVEGEQ